MLLEVTIYIIIVAKGLFGVALEKSKSTFDTQKAH
jgi:hypothetical protein